MDGTEGVGAEEAGAIDGTEGVDIGAVGALTLGAEDAGAAETRAPRARVAKVAMDAKDGIVV